VSDHENDPFGETQDAPEPLAAFEAFRPSTVKEQAPTEPFPAEYLSEPTAVLPTAQAEPAGRYGAGDAGYGAGPTGAGQMHGRKRSLLIFGGVAVLAIGLGAGAYAIAQPSGGQASASSPAVSATPTPAASNGAKSGKAMTARLTVTTVGTDSFIATTPNGTAVTVRILPTTRFGTAARPFTRGQLVAGADVVARLRREANGTVVAMVIAAGTAAASASASAGA
jgi:hypothetical protein